VEGRSSAREQVLPSPTIQESPKATMAVASLPTIVPFRSTASFSAEPAYCDCAVDSDISLLPLTIHVAGEPAEVALQLREVRQCQTNTPNVRSFSFEAYLNIRGGCFWLVHKAKEGDINREVEFGLENETANAHREDPDLSCISSGPVPRDQIFK
jgi:hypothetical protein